MPFFCAHLLSFYQTSGLVNPNPFGSPSSYPQTGNSLRSLATQHSPSAYTWQFFFHLSSLHLHTLSTWFIINHTMSMKRLVLLLRIIKEGITAIETCLVHHLSTRFHHHRQHQWLIPRHHNIIHQILINHHHHHIYTTTLIRCYLNIISLTKLTILQLLILIWLIIHRLLLILLPCHHTTLLAVLPMIERTWNANQTTTSIINNMLHLVHTTINVITPMVNILDRLVLLQPWATVKDHLINIQSCLVTVLNWLLEVQK